MIDLVLVSVFFGAVRVACESDQSQCVWQHNGGHAATCRARAVHICDAWKELKHKVTNDPYTNVYYEDLYCSATCLARKTKTSCSRDSSCIWFGSSESEGFCRGVTASGNYKWQIIEKGKQSLHDPSLDNKFISRHAPFSYSIVEFGCYEVCRNAAIGVSARGCEMMHWCCHSFELANGTNFCSADTVKIANRISPQLLPIAQLERSCRVRNTESDCVGRRSEL